MTNDSKKILEKHAEEERRQAMTKRMAEEEIRKNDFNVNGYQGDRILTFSMGSWKWENMGIGKKILVIIAGAAFAAIMVLFILGQCGLL
ncbi:MAG: hypothetical protein R3232_03610 [Clostridia bacterium]|nr:hypothetical protein [Clostridia bacterium]